MIEGFDEDLAAELQNRAQEALERREEASRSERRELGVEDDVAALPHLTEAMLVTLGKAGVKTLDDLADLSTAELQDILPSGSLSAEDAGSLIMAARASWDND